MENDYSLSVLRSIAGYGWSDRKWNNGKQKELEIAVINDKNKNTVFRSIFKISAEKIHNNIFKYEPKGIRDENRIKYGLPNKRVNGFQVQCWHCNNYYARVSITIHSMEKMMKPEELTTILNVTIFITRTRTDTWICRGRPVFTRLSLTNLFQVTLPPPGPFSFTLSRVNVQFKILRGPSVSITAISSWSFLRKSMEISKRLSQRKEDKESRHDTS